MGGEIRLGRQTVPISSPIALQGGIQFSEPSGAETFVAALGSQTLSKVPQRVPGGLSGLIDCAEVDSVPERSTCQRVVAGGFAAVTATTELARPAGEIGLSKANLLNQEGIALSLPIKVHLTNPLLGSGCYIGSSSKPMILNLLSGTTDPPPPNKPIKGSVGRLTSRDRVEIIESSGVALVDNAFYVPAVVGCGGANSSLLDPIIDRRIGLPSAAGYNTAVLDETLEEGTAESVIASET
jgi:hypothetical protein